MKYCTSCLMPETAESIVFDESGVCSVCRQIEFKTSKIDWAAKQDEMRNLIEDYRGKHEYDCIVPFSGGKDSTFTLWYLVTQLDLKPLVVRFDHGFYRPTLLKNNIKTFRALGVDAITFTPNWQVVRKLMFESLRRRGDFCWHCHTGIFAYPMRVALEKKVPLLFWGEPGAEYSSYYSYEDAEEVDEERFNRKVNLGINAEDMLGMLDDTISDYKVTDRDLLPFTYPSRADLRALKVRSVLLGKYIPWDVKKQVQIIKDELGWEGDQVEGVPPEYDYEKIECFMQGVRDYIKHLKRGYGRTTHLASIDIRNGRLDREHGRQLVEEYDGKRPAALDLFLDYLGLDEARFLEMIEPHVVSPHQMPDCETCMKNRVNQVPADFEQWSKITGDRLRDKERGFAGS